MKRRGQGDVGDLPTMVQPDSGADTYNVPLQPPAVLSHLHSILLSLPVPSCPLSLPPLCVYLSVRHTHAHRSWVFLLISRLHVPQLLSCSLPLSRLPKFSSRVCLLPGCPPQVHLFSLLPQLWPQYVSFSLPAPWKVSMEVLQTALMGGSERCHCWAAVPCPLCEWQTPLLSAGALLPEPTTAWPAQEAQNVFLGRSWPHLGARASLNVLYHIFIPCT